MEEYGDSKYPWATRVNGGVGESILIFFPKPDTKFESWQKGFGIVNGFSKSKFLYEANSRAKDIEVILYRMELGFGVVNRNVYPKMMWVIPEFFQSLEQTNIKLTDEYLFTNNFYFNVDLEKDYDENKDELGGIFEYALVLRITSVYKGNKYNDLCISRIIFLTNSKDMNSGSETSETN